MGISGIGNSTPYLRTERSILEQSMGETTGTHRPVDFDASSSHSQTRTNPTQYVSTLQIENIASQIVDEDVEKNKSIWQKNGNFRHGRYFKDGYGGAFLARCEKHYKSFQNEA